MMEQAKPSVLAQPLAEREWQVVAGDSRSGSGAKIVGFIEELGGTYEVDVVNQPELSKFFDTFKGAMDHFAQLEQSPKNRDAMQPGAA